MEQEIIERIKEFYKPEITDTLRLGGRAVPVDDKTPIFLGFGEKYANAAEARLCGAVETTGLELHKIFRPDWWEANKHRFEKMQNYLLEIQKSIGLIESKSGYGEPRGEFRTTAAGRRHIGNVFRSMTTP